MGDGSILMNIQELATVIRHKLLISIFLLNNKGHSMVQQTQTQWLDSEPLLPKDEFLDNMIIEPLHYSVTEELILPQDSDLHSGT